MQAKKRYFLLISIGILIILLCGLSSKLRQRCFLDSDAVSLRCFEDMCKSSEKISSSESKKVYKFRFENSNISSCLVFLLWSFELKPHNKIIIQKPITKSYGPYKIQDIIHRTLSRHVFSFYPLIH
jgi:hypothetical protein